MGRMGPAWAGGAIRIQGASSKVVRDINRSIVLNLIRTRQPVSRADLSRAWNPDLSSRRIAEEWMRLIFGNDPAVVKTINGIHLTSWRTFENYTRPLGLQTLTDIAGNHCGVPVEASKRSAGKNPAAALFSNRLGSSPASSTISAPISALPLL